LRSPDGERNGKNIKGGLIACDWSLSTRPGPRPTLPAATAARRAAEGWSPKSCRAAGAGSPSWLNLRHDCIDAPCVIDGPINGESFSPMSSRCSSRPSTPATSLSLSTSAATRVRPCAAPSKQPVPNYSSSRPIARSQPDRTSVCQAQKPAAQSCRTNRRSSRMRQLFRKRWIRVSLIRSRS